MLKKHHVRLRNERDLHSISRAVNVNSVMSGNKKMAMKVRVPLSKASNCVCVSVCGKKARELMIEPSIRSIPSDIVINDVCNCISVPGNRILKESRGARGGGISNRSTWHGGSSWFARRVLVDGLPAKTMTSISNRFRMRQTGDKGGRGRGRKKE